MATTKPHTRTLKNEEKSKRINLRKAIQRSMMTHLIAYRKTRLRLVAWTQWIMSKSTKTTSSNCEHALAASSKSQTLSTFPQSRTSRTKYSLRQLRWTLTSKFKTKEIQQLRNKTKANPIWTSVTYYPLITVLKAVLLSSHFTFTTTLP